MQGLDLCERYYHEHGLPKLQSELGKHFSRLTIGLAGHGSECLGFDDELSRDHDWGPGFCIWIDSVDFQMIGPEVQNLYDRLPKSYAGFAARKTSRWGEGRVGVLNTDLFYQSYLGLTRAPVTLKEWLAIPENALATATSGRLFHDPKSNFSTIRSALLDYYPEDVRLKKIASRCMIAGQAGQYNYPRSLKRQEPYAAAQAEMKFVEAALSLIFLINKHYLPFYKWAHKALKALPVLGPIADRTITRLLENHSAEEKEQSIESLAQAIITQLKQLGLTNSSSDFLPDHGPMIHSHIRDDELRSYSVWVG